MKNYIVLTLVIFAGFCSDLNGQTLITTEEFASKLRELGTTGQLVDVRTSNEFAQGHLAGATNIDFKSPEFATNIDKLDKSKPVMLYCLGGSRSAGAAKILVEKGFEVFDMHGGYVKWTSEEKPVDGVPARKKSDNVSPLTLEDGEFTKLIAGDKPVLIDFTAKWCAPCQLMLPYIKKLGKEFEGRAVVKTIDFDANRDLGAILGINALPALFLYKNGQLVWKKTGVESEEGFRTLLTQNL